MNQERAALAEMLCPLVRGQQMDGEVASDAEAGFTGSAAVHPSTCSSPAPHL